MSGIEMQPDLEPTPPWADRAAADEAVLIARAQRDPAAFGELYERYYEPILHYVYRRTLDIGLTEELTSNTFFKALEGLPRYRHRGQFRAWLYRIATNEIKGHHRTTARRPVCSPLGPEDLERVCFASDGSCLTVAAKLQAFAQLHAALCQLPEAYQEVLSLRYFEGMAHAEIATVLGRRLGTVKSLVHRGLKRLKQLLPMGTWEAD